MLEAVARRPALDHDRGVHLLARRDRAGVRQRDRRAGQGRRAGEAAARRRRLGDHRRRDPEVLDDGGCQLAWFNPIGWYTLDRFNYRTHRKSLIIDGRVAFTGGAGIADHWRGYAQDPEHWRDMQIRIEGPGAMPLQTGFAQNWLRTTGEMVSGPEFFPPARAGGRGGGHDGAELAVGRRVARAHALLPGDRLRPPLDPDRQPVFRARPGGGGRVARGARARRRRAGHRLRHPQRQLAGAPQQRAPVRPAARGRRRDLRIQPHDAAPEDDGRRRRLGDDRHRQLRQPLVRLQRREQRLDPRRRLHRAAGDRSSPTIGRSANGSPSSAWKRRGVFTQAQELVAALFEDQV